MARGNSSVVINGTGTVALNGDVVFEYDKSSSGTTADSIVNISLNGSNARWIGKAIVSWLGRPADDSYLKVHGFTLGLSNGAVWTPTVFNSTKARNDNGSDLLAVNMLNLDGGVINIANDVKVKVEKMSDSSSGTINLVADGTTAGTFDVEKVVNGEEESGEVALAVNLVNDQFEALTADNITAEQATKLLNNVGGQNDAVKTSTYVAEGFANEGFSTDKEGNVKSSGPNTLMQSSLEMATGTPLALNRILMNDVRKRLGDIRTAQGTHGVWARYDGGRLSGENGLENDFNTIQIGIDTMPTPNSARLGLALSYTKGDTDYARGSADMDAYSLSAYGVWLGEHGQFIDVIGRLAKTDTDMVVDGNLRASMNNLALSLSAETGWRFDVTDMFYAEPQVELTYTYVNGSDLDWGAVHYDVDDTHSLLGRLGIATGLKCPNNKGNVYVRASVVHEFLGDSKLRAQLATGGTNINEIDGKDTWIEYGIGANFNVSESTYIYADVERTSGGVLDEDWRATLGVRYSF